ncbi:TetR/AcrR family transcriptional regulator [Gordonia shandongensis]|uniref:TetR/AcrR family transcriptional regulator n=1 Tax=Gordonia shandongensis TaxID=376351 RepID=UPI00040D70B5|nr:TetR/AcrR family transcriptional regulator [Gordonia shandongensis]
MAVKDQLITATAELMRRRGVAGTAVSDILAESGAARRSIYLNFPDGKAQLVTEATRAAGTAITGILEGLTDDPDPIGTFVSMWAALLDAADYDAGCPVVAAALGRSEAPTAADEAGTVFATWQTLVHQRLVADGIDPKAADSLATTVLAAVEGAVLIAQAQRTTRPLVDVGEQLAALVDIHRPPR